MDFLKIFTTSFEHPYGPGYTISIIPSTNAQLKKKVMLRKHISSGASRRRERSVKFLQLRRHRIPDVGRADSLPIAPSS